MPLAARAAASARPSSPHGRTISTIAMMRKTRTIEILGKTRMPKALSSDTMIAARKVPGTLPRPPITTTTSASVITCRSIVWLAACRGSSSAPPRPARKTPSAKTLVNNHFWLTPRAATISRSCVAARTSTPQVVRRKSSHRNARTSGARAMSSKSYVGKGWPKRSIAPLNPGARGPSSSLGPQISNTRSSTTSVTPKVASN